MVREEDLGCAKRTIEALDFDIVMSPVAVAARMEELRQLCLLARSLGETTMLGPAEPRGSKEHRRFG